MTAKKELRRTKRKLYVVAKVSIVGRLFEFIVGVFATIIGIFFIYISVTEVTKVTLDVGYNFILVGILGVGMVIFSPPMAKEGFDGFFAALNTLQKYRKGQREVPNPLQKK